MSCEPSTEIITDAVASANVGAFERAISTLKGIGSGPHTALANELAAFIDRIREATQEKENIVAELQFAHAETEEANDDLRSAIARAQASEAYSRAVVDNAADGILTYDTQGTIQTANRAAENMFGIEPGGLAGRHIHDLTPEAESWSKDSVQDHEQEAVRRDGTTFPMSRRTSNFNGGAGTSYVAVVRDLSRRRQDEARIRKLNTQLFAASRQAGMAEVATGVLHNVGNVLNSVNVGVETVQRELQSEVFDKPDKLAGLLGQHEKDLGDWFTRDRAAQVLPKYTRQLADALTNRRNAALDEVQTALGHIQHLKVIVSTHQSVAKSSGAEEFLSIPELLDAALEVHANAFGRHGVMLVREFEYVDEVLVDRHALLQIVINLISNAKRALLDREGNRQVVVGVELEQGERLKIVVTDNGVGIPAENLERVFEHGFTTYDDGHGFGLHSSANLAAAMGGSLSCVSAGEGAGATFTLCLPLRSRVLAKAG